MKCTSMNVTPASFAKAIDKTKALLAKKGDVEITLSLAGGAYNLDEAIVLDAAESVGEKRLRMIGGGRIKPVFSAMTAIPTENFKKVEGKPYYVCQLEKAADGQYPNIRAFYANGKIADVARTSEYRSCLPFERDGVQWMPRQQDWGTTYDHRLYVPVEAVEEAGIPNCAGAELHIRVEWEFKIFHIDYIDMEDTYVNADGKKFVAMQLVKNESKFGNGGLGVHSRVFFICNTTSVLTTPGQYAYERAEGKIYYYPVGDIKDCTFGIGKQTSLFSFKNFESVTLRGITFTGVEDEILTATGYYAAGQAGSWGVFPEIFPHAGAVKVYNINEMDVDACNFTDLPCDGISMVGVLNNVTIHNSRFTNVGASAIRVGRPKDYSETDQINNIRIENNFLDNIGFTYENSCSIIVTKVRDGKLNHNTVLRSSYSAFSLGWKWNVGDWEYGEKVNLENVEVAYNYIKSFVMNMRDGGGIYTLGGNVKVDYAPVINTLHDNYVIEDEYTCPEDGFFGALYHDGASSNWHTYENIQILNPLRMAPLAPHYIQNIEGQEAQNILVANNDIIGAYKDWETYSNNLDLSELDWEYALFGEDTRRFCNLEPWGHLYEYYSRINDDSRYLAHEGNVLHDSPEDFELLGYTYYVMAETGSSLCPPDPDVIIYEMMQPIYDEYYVILEEMST